MAKQRQMTNAFGGINVLETGNEGELTNGKNLSADCYPCLATREGRVKTDTVPNADAFTIWDGRKVWVKDSGLYIDGEKKANIQSGEKQFAVVNTKLIVWPDGIYYDSASEKVKKLAEYTQLANITLKDGSITGTVQGFESMEASLQCTKYESWPRYDSGMGANSRVYLYETLEGEGQWVWTRTIYLNPDDYIGWYVKPAGSTQDGFLLHYEQGWVPGQVTEYNAAENTEGVYGKIAAIDTGREVMFMVDFTIQLYKSGVTSNLKDMFTAGDVVEVRSEQAYLNGDYRIKSVYENGIDTNAVGLKLAAKYAQVGAELAAGDYYYLKASGTYYKLKTENDYYDLGEAGRIWIYSNDSWILCDSEGKTRESGTAESGQRGTQLGVVNVDAADVVISAERKIPKMDYICASNNRLWGVSNRAENYVYDDNGNKKEFEGRAIYASALGDPTNFFDYSGLSTDSYAVGVASDGDFTGIASYSDDVLAFKENETVRITGQYPAAYYMYTYQVPGVRRGCHKAICIAANILYYVTNEGVYKYWSSYNTGRQNISRQLGDIAMDGARMGTDGNRLYLYTNEMLYTYDIENGLWNKEDDAKVIDFARSGEKLYFMSDSGIWETAGAEFAGEWEAVFRPLDETMMNRKNYRRLAFRGEGGTDFSVYARLGEETEKLRLDIEDMGSWWVARCILPPNRVDRLRLRICGTGSTKIREMQREYIALSEEL